ncbi:unnamed protein product [Effrenium voratum]|nr:unnamed protein product [Effrenium voratum]CAJ1441424.1 unnamed protein product [Effrenium voratum]
MDMELGPGFSPGTGFALRCRAAVISCLHRLSCHMCLPPPQLPDSFRLLLGSFLFGAAGGALAAAEAWPWVPVYCALGLTRIATRRVLVLALLLAACFCLASWLSDPAQRLCNAVLVILLELCWFRTMEKVLNHWFESFVAVIYLFMGVLMVFAFYPALLHYGPELLNADFFTKKSDSEVLQDTSGTASESDIFAFSLLPLLFIVGIPLLSMVVLIYCWMCHHMFRMVLAVGFTFVAWLVTYALLEFLHVPFSRDMLGKGLLVTVCVVMYGFFTRMTSLDWENCTARAAFVSAGFVASFMLDAIFGAAEGEVGVRTLYTMFLACKAAYFIMELAIDKGAETLLQLLPPLIRRAESPELQAPAPSDDSERLQSGYEMMAANDATRREVE